MVRQEGSKVEIKGMLGININKEITIIQHIKNLYSKQ